MTAQAAHTRRQQRGFALLEALVAIAILGLGLALAWEVYATQGRSQTQAADRLLLLGQAGDLMEAWLAQPGVEPGLHKGSQGRVRWEVRVDDITPPPPPSRLKDPEAEGKLPRLLGVQVCCRLSPPASIRPVCLQSARLALPPDKADAQQTSR
jgi:prepilin-type N-terminal cleavage/methylation domain-containing protein